MPLFLTRKRNLLILTIINYNSCAVKLYAVNSVNKIEIELKG